MAAARRRPRRLSPQASAQRVVAWIDTATGLPVTPNGGDITVSWDNGTNKIFKL